MAYLFFVANQAIGHFDSLKLKCELNPKLINPKNARKENMAYHKLFVTVKTLHRSLQLRIIVGAPLFFKREQEGRGEPQSKNELSLLHSWSTQKSVAKNKQNTEFKAATQVHSVLAANAKGVFLKAGQKRPEPHCDCLKMRTNVRISSLTIRQLYFVSKNQFDTKESKLDKKMDWCFCLDL